MLRLLLVVLLGTFPVEHPPAQPAAAPAAESGTVSVTVTRLRSDDGQVLFSLYDDGDGFPTKPSKAKRLKKAKISNGRARASFGSLAPGTYAVSVIHDENGNGKLDTNWLGIPKEGVGASNNAKGRMGPPKFEDAKFQVGPDKVVQRIRMQYI